VGPFQICEVRTESALRISPIFFRRQALCGSYFDFSLRAAEIGYSFLDIPFEQ
jgi:hypothetical protein